MALNGAIRKINCAGLETCKYPFIEVVFKN